MSKGNPIVGLAHVVASQQEMLEEANCKIAELVYQKDKRVNALEEENAKLQHKCEEKDATITDLRAELSKTREDLQNANDDCNYLSVEHDRMKKQLIELEDQLKIERSNPFHWQKWEEGKEFPLDKFGNVPWVDGLYLFNDDSKRTVWMEKERLAGLLAGKYSIDVVETHCPAELRARGVFKVVPPNSLLKEATLVAVSIRDMAEATRLDSMPKLIDK